VSNFEGFVEEIINFEGGYADHPDDRGGKTMYGITERVARGSGYEGDMRDLPVETAKEIYRSNYWDNIRLDEINNATLQFILFDTAVNMGVGTAIDKLQRTYNMLSESTITVDGVIGPQTIGAVNNYAHIGILKFAYLIMRGERYFDIVRSRHSQKSFIRGWLNRLRSMTLELEEFSNKEGEKMLAREEVKAEVINDICLALSEVLNESI